VRRGGFIHYTDILLCTVSKTLSLKQRNYADGEGRQSKTVTEKEKSQCNFTFFSSASDALLQHSLNNSGCIAVEIIQTAAVSWRPPFLVALDILTTLKFQRTNDII
jgi:hypothetical protein